MHRNPLKHKIVSLPGPKRTLQVSFRLLPRPEIYQLYTKREIFEFERYIIVSAITKMVQRRAARFVSNNYSRLLKAPANEETLLRKHCCFSKCFPVCADRKHLLRKHFLLSRNKKCFWLFSETFCCFKAGVHMNAIFSPLNVGLMKISCSRFKQSNSWFSLTSYQNSEALNNRFGFQNVYGIVENSKLHIWAKFWSERTFRLRVIGTRVSDIFSKKCIEWPSWCPT